MQPEFSVVILTYQQPALLLKCLDALGRQRLPRDQFEVIVVDDGNSPEIKTAVQLFARQIAREGSPLEVRYVEQPERRGPAAARNRGWQAARGHVIAFTNDDCQADTEWLSSALPNFKCGTQMMVGQLRVLLQDQASLLNRRATTSRQADVMAANCFCRKSTLEQMGGFDEAFGTTWQEDSNLQARFNQAGILIEKCPEAVVIRSVPGYGISSSEQINGRDTRLYKQPSRLLRDRIFSYRRQIAQSCVAVLSILVGSPR